jgi:hypothetical protein
VSIQPSRCAANERVNGLAAVRTFLQIVSSIGIIVGLLAAVAAVMYAFCWTVLLLVRFVPVSADGVGTRGGTSSRNDRGGGRDVRKVDRVHGP